MSSTFSTLFVICLLLLNTIVEAGNVNPASVKNRKRCTACRKRRYNPPPSGPDTPTSSAAAGAPVSSGILAPGITTTTTVTTRAVPTTTSSTTRPGDAAPSPSPNVTSPDAVSTSGTGKLYKIVDQYEGNSFFDAFEFQAIPDPTHGNVNYLPRDAAMGAGLAYVQDDGVVVMKVDDYSHVAPGGNRNSVRLESKKGIDSGLLVLDVQSMPFGCGVWPAFWTVGANWPNGGEIDILEGVHDSSQGQYTLHTAPGCQVDQGLKVAQKRGRRHVQGPGSPSGHHGRAGSQHHQPRGDVSPLAGGLLTFSGKVLSPNCDATVNSNTGCGIQDPDTRSYGSALNKAGGGMFATLLDEHGVAIWFFPRDSIPEDLASSRPRPAGWGTPKAFWSSSSCPTHRFFGEQKIVINTTLCGDWAGATYASVGCPGACGDRVADPNNFKTAQWKINSVKVYE